MRRRIRLPATLTAALLLTGSLTTAGAADPPEPEAAGAPRTPATPRTITLITGDKVTVSPTDEVRFAPGQGSGSTGAAISRSQGHTYVVPSSARADVVAGRLDLELFDVTTLITQRYDDASSKVLPTIVEYAGNSAAARQRAGQDKLAGTRINRLLTSIGARGATVDKAAAPQFWRSVTDGSKRVDKAIARIRLDHRVKANLDRSVPQIGAPAAWQRGLTGQGVKVAVLDTGIDATHPDLTGKVAAAQNFSESPEVTDHLGHGTHVAGTIAGSGAAAGGAFKGVAPDATLLNGKVLADDGFGYESGIIAGMEWAVAQGADVINMSLGGGPTDGTDTMSEALNTLTASSGALFVVSAGNCFPPVPQQVSTPASADAALAVANLERDGSLAETSCRGPRSGDRSLKPEIAAPGSGIVAPRAAGSEIGEPVGEHYTTLSGTSMAAPHVSGSAALLVQQQPDLNAGQLKTRLMTTADPQPGAAVTGSGAGRVDADQATAGQASVDTAELEFGYLKWPHPDPAPVTKTLTYHNSGTTPLTLDLAVQLDPGVTAAAPTLSAPQVVVPAGGQATVDLTARFAPEHTGQVAGQVVATPAGGKALVTDFGWYSSPEEYKLTIELTGFDGQPTDSIINLDRVDGGDLPFLDLIFTNGGKATLILPPGRYAVTTDLYQEPTDDTPPRWAMAVQPEFTLGADSTVKLDARTAKPVDVGVPGRSDLRSDYTSATYRRRASTGLGTWAGLDMTALSGITKMYATPAAAPSTGTAQFSLSGRLKVPEFAARYADGAELPVVRPQYAPLMDGVKALVAVDAGTARPEDLTGVRGKLAVIEHTEDIWPQEQFEAAAAAGAAGIISYRKFSAGLFRGFIDPRTVSVPVLNTSRVAAADLLERIGKGETTVRITGVDWSPVTYDLLRPTPGGGIPAKPVLRPRQNEFAVVDTVVGTHGDGPGQESVMELRTGRTDFGFAGGYLLIPDALVPGPRRRTSYVLGGPVEWSEQFITTSADQSDGSEWFSTWRSYRAGQRTTERWFGPVASTGLRDDGPIIPAVTRYPDFLSVALSPFTHGHGLYEPACVPCDLPGDFTMKVSRNGELLGTADSTIEGFVVPAEPGDFRIEVDARRELSWWKFSTRVRSEWEFRSEGKADEEQPPMMAADLEVPQANVYNQVKAGVPTTIKVGLRHQADSPASAITSAKLELSYDGSTWTRLPLRSLGDGKYVTSVKHPAGQAVHLRVEGKDAAGGLIRQEITRAYAVTR